MTDWAAPDRRAELWGRRVQYETDGLDVAGVDPDPVVQWDRWHQNALEGGVPEPNAMTVATVDADGVPDARIVLVRQADPWAVGRDAIGTNPNQVSLHQIVSATAVRNIKAVDGQPIAQIARNHIVLNHIVVTDDRQAELRPSVRVLKCCVSGAVGADPVV